MNFEVVILDLSSSSARWHSDHFSIMENKYRQWELLQHSAWSFTGCQCVCVKCTLLLTRWSLLQTMPFGYWNSALCIIFLPSFYHYLKRHIYNFVRYVKKYANHTYNLHGVVSKFYGTAFFISKIFICYWYGRKIKKEKGRQRDRESNWAIDLVKTNILEHNLRLPPRACNSRKLKPGSEGRYWILIPQSMCTNAVHLNFYASYLPFFCIL